MNRKRPRLIYLLGFMGCGKSTIGSLLAQQLGWPFVDLDTTIEAGQGVTVREIFENSGEGFFRELEHLALVEACRTEPVVIALGGGTVAQEVNLKFIRERGGTTIWLDCPIEELLQRCADKNNRPLFRDPVSFARLYEQRLPYYRLADCRVSTSGRTPQDVIDQILQHRVY